MKKTILFIFTIVYLQADSFLINVENDFINNTDRHLTNSIQTSWMLDSNSSLYDSFSLELIQDIYTPENIKENDPSKFDIPYGGHLYSKLSWHFIYKNYLHSIGFILGKLGKDSFAKQTQATLHKIIGANKPKGWNHQIDERETYAIDYNFIHKTYKNEEFSINNQLHLISGNFEETATFSTTFLYNKTNHKNFQTLSSFSKQINLKTQTGISTYLTFFGTYRKKVYILDNYKDEYGIQRNKNFIGTNIGIDFYNKNHIYTINLKTVKFSLNKNIIKEKWLGLGYIYIF